ncbi:MAG: ABC transporter ATP-binding protein [Planctomycetes bacterium]|nr:ABC transporter ATP-binding protein [Planctomycetota bacterium]
MNHLWRAIKLLFPLKKWLALYMVCAILLAAVSSAPLGLGNVLLYNLQQSVGQPNATAGSETADEHMPQHKIKAGKDAISKWANEYAATWFGTGSSLVYGLCICILVCLVIKGILDFLVSYLQNYIAMRLQMDATVRVMRHALTLDIGFFDNEKMADLGIRIYGDTTTLRTTAKVTLDMLEKPPYILFLLCLAVYLNWQLFLLGAVGIPIIVLPFLAFTRKLYKNTRKAIHTSIDMAQAGGQVLGGMRMVRAYNAVDAESENFAKLANRFTRFVMNKVVLRAIQRPLTEILLSLGAIAVMIVGSNQVLNHEMDLSSFLTFVATLGMLTSPVRGLLNTLGDIVEFVPSAERTFEILDHKPKIVEKPNAVACPALAKEISFENVTLDYGRGPIFRNLSFTVKKGERIGIVGRTGVGKSSLIYLLLRFYEPVEGALKIDGVDIRDTTFSSLRAQMALVSPDTFLFHTTIEENIRYGKPGASLDAVMEAAKAAAIHDEIMSFPEGYQTVTGPGGATLSSGQRQRVAVARAILRDAPILLLDEATSAMDTASEARVQAALDRLSVGRTSIVIAHRLSTVKNADRIVVFAEKGGIEAIAPHNELLTLSPTYKKLWDRLAGRGDDASTDELSVA